MRQAILSSGDSTIINEYYKWIALKENLAKAYAFGQDTRELEREANEIEQQLIKNSALFSDYNKAKNLKCLKPISVWKSA